MLTLFVDMGVGTGLVYVTYLHRADQLTESSVALFSNKFININRV